MPLATEVGQSERLVFEPSEWEVDLVARELRAHGVAVPIGSRAFEIVEVLVGSVGELVTRDELIARVWPGAIVEENTLRFISRPSARHWARIGGC